MPSSPRVLARGLAFAHGGGPPLFTSVDLDLGPGVHAVVGPNGAGKTTLLRLLAGELEPTAGALRREPAELRAHRLRQTLDAPTEEVERLAACWDGEACRLRARLALDDGGPFRWPTLSPGERQRWQLAAALHGHDDGLLVLDEPTNHLDATGREALRGLLGEARGLVLLVSHDRALVDALASHTLWVEAGRVRCFAGGYAAASEQRAAEREASRRERSARRRELTRLGRERAARRERAAGAARAISTRTRSKGVRDSDARSAPRKGRAVDAAATHARAAGQLDARVRRAEEALASAPLERVLGGPITLEGRRAAGRFALRASVGPLAVGARLLLPRRPFVVARDARVHLAGPNGAGKSTLLRALATRWDGPAEGLLHLPQDLDEPARRAALADTLALPADARGEVLGLLAALGVDPKAVLKTPLPSPGEARKLLLAGALHRPTRLLLLDEPEGHLDAPSRERLEDALEAFPGALVLVSHDDCLAERTCDTRWWLEGGALREETRTGGPATTTGEAMADGDRTHTRIASARRRGSLGRAGADRSGGLARIARAGWRGPLMRAGAEHGRALMQAVTR